MSPVVKRQRSYLSNLLVRGSPPGGLMQCLSTEIASAKRQDFAPTRMQRRPSFPWVVGGVSLRQLMSIGRQSIFPCLCQSIALVVHR
jgi:hypothetical protein